MSDILLTDENVVVLGRLGVGTRNPVGPLHADGSITSSGSNAGFHFSDWNPLAGGWSWYAQNGKARLSVDPRGDVLEVDSTNGLRVGSLHVDGAVRAKSVNANSVSVDSFHVSLLVSLNQSGLAVADAPGPSEIRASSILVTSPKASPVPGGPVAGGPHPQLPTETLDLIAEVKALRQEVNALKTKIGA